MGDLDRQADGVITEWARFRYVRRDEGEEVGWFAPRRLSEASFDCALWSGASFVVLDMAERIRGVCLVYKTRECPFWVELISATRHFGPSWEPEGQDADVERAMVRLVETHMGLIGVGLALTQAASDARIALLEGEGWEKVAFSSTDPAYVHDPPHGAWVLAKRAAVRLRPADWLNT